MDVFNNMSCLGVSRLMSDSVLHVSVINKPYVLFANNTATKAVVLCDNESAVVNVPAMCLIWKLY